MTIAKPASTPGAKNFGFIVTAADGIAGSSAETDYAFTLKVPIAGQNDEAMKLQFVDMPGGWYVQAATADMICANQNISRSAASFWVIDTVAMMEDVPGKNRHHRAIIRAKFMTLTKRRLA